MLRSEQVGWARGDQEGGLEMCVQLRRALQRKLKIDLSTGEPSEDFKKESDQSGKIRRQPNGSEGSGDQTGSQ